MVDDRRTDLVGGLRTDKRFRELALKISLKLFGVQFTLKGVAIQTEEFLVGIGVRPRRFFR